MTTATAKRTTSRYLRARAGRCRELAQVASDGGIADALIELAEAFEAEASKREAESARTGRRHSRNPST